jgi:hypothetical protein
MAEVSARFGAVKIPKEKDEPVRGGTASEADDLSHALLDAQKNARVRMSEKCDCFESEMKHGAGEDCGRVTAARYILSAPGSIRERSFITHGYSEAIFGCVDWSYSNI